MKILIVDDDATNRLILESSLTRLGHKVAMTTNGKEAWTAYLAQDFPVVISDWMMPEWDGLELCRAIRKRRSNHYTIVLLLTSRGGKLDYLEAMKAGVDDFLTKPFDVDQLAARILVAERILGLQTQVKQLQGLLPICAYCKRIRDSDQSWREVEEYIAQRSEAHFSHGICPTCTKEFFADTLKSKSQGKP